MRRSTPVPADGGPAGGGMPARRAMARWAWRLFRREWRQQVLAVTIIAAAVAATILGAAVATSSPPPANSGFGSANHLVTLPGSDPTLAPDIAAIRARFGTVNVIENQTIATGLVGGAQLRAQDPHGPYGGAMLALVSGRYPNGAREVAMTQQLATSLGLRLGGVWHQGGRSLRVVGIVEDPQDLLDNFALVAPGQLSSPAQVTVLFDATPTSLQGFTFPHGAVPLTPSRAAGLSPAVVVLAVAIIGLIFVGLVVTASFTVLAQRRTRSLGMLASLGATDRDVRLVMVAHGAVVGVVGAALGAAAGLAVWTVYAPFLSNSAHHRIAWTNLPWWMIATALALTIATAIAAALRPARAVASTSTVAALSGRPPLPTARHRMVPGIVLLALGPVLLAFSGGWTGNSPKDVLFQLGGIAASAIGLLFVSPLALALLAMAARRAPAAARIAWRDIVRYRARSGAALAATSFAVFIAVLIILLAGGRFADPIDYTGPNLASNQLVLCAPGYGPSGSGHSSGSTAGLLGKARRVAASLGTHNILSLRQVAAYIQGSQSYGDSSLLYVATPALLRHFGIDPGAIDPATVLITSRPNLKDGTGLQLMYCRSPVLSHPWGPVHALTDPSIQTFASLPTGTSAPNLLITSRAAQELRLRPGLAGWFIQTGRPPSAVQLAVARQAALSADMTIESRNEEPSLGQLRNYATGVALLLVVGVLAVMVGLIRSEMEGEYRTLVSVGAGTRIRRGISGVTAGSIALLGAILGTGVAYLATVAFFRNQLSERMGQVPVVDLLFILVVLPLLATAGGWLLAGREPSAIARRPIE